MNNCILLLSSPRSGSSFLTSVIKKLGFNTGVNESQTKDRFNEKGYFENSNILRFNERVLHSVGSSIFSTSDLSKEQEEETLNYKNELINIIKSEYTSDFIIKDMRIILLRRLYLECLEDLNVNVKIIALFRDPHKSAESFSKMTNKTFAETLSIMNYYQNYLHSLEEDNNLLKIQLEEIQKSRKEIKKIAYFLNCPYNESVNLLYDESLIHHK